MTTSTSDIQADNIQTTTPNLIGKRVRYSLHTGDFILREECDSILVGLCGTVTGLEKHTDISTYELTQEEQNDDKWIIVCLDDGQEGVAFWKEELQLISGDAQQFLIN